MFVSRKFSKFFKFEKIRRKLIHPYLKIKTLCKTPQRKGISWATEPAAWSVFFICFFQNERFLDLKKTPKPLSIFGRINTFHFFEIIFLKIFKIFVFFFKNEKTLLENFRSGTKIKNTGGPRGGRDALGHRLHGGAVLLQDVHG